MSGQANRGGGAGSARILFAGGGTGGHVYMAVALRQELRKREPRVPGSLRGYGGWPGEPHSAADRLSP